MQHITLTMSLLSEITAMAEEGPGKKENPVIAILNIFVKGENKTLEIKRHSNPEKLGREFVRVNDIGERSLPAIIDKIRAMAAEGNDRKTMKMLPGV